MKKILMFLLLGAASVGALRSQTRMDSDGNTVYHPLSVVAEYQMGEFEYAEETSWYGVGIVFSSISHWGRFHVGGNANASINAGIVKPWGCLIDFGPSARIDITDHCFVNIPVNAVYKSVSEDDSSWGCKVAPSLYVYVSDRFGLFFGPKVTFADSESVWGMQAGISICF